MIRVTDETALEKLLKDCRFTNEAHKEQLMERLMSEVASDVLSLDELDMAAGGMSPQAIDVPSEPGCK